MKLKTIALAQFFIFLIISPVFGQTCTSSGGDYDPDNDLDIEPYIFRCGTAMMRDRHQKVSPDYKLIKACNNYYSDGNYYRNKGKIYYSPEYASFELIANADAKSFRCEEGTPRDNSNIYFKGKAVTNVDKSSFKSVGFTYCSDSKNVYYRNRYNQNGKLLKLEDAVPASFILVGEPGSNYAKDDKSAYFNGKVITMSDPESFTLLDYGYAHDKNYVYYNGEMVDGMKGDNFKVLKNCFLGSDGIKLCNGPNVLKNSDSKSFRAIECGYYKDNNNIYLNGAILDGIDSKTFKILTWGYTKDKNAVYCDLKLIKGAKPSSFEILGRKHARDSQHIFYLNNTILCDYKSFEVSNQLDYLSKDKDYDYKKGVRINN